MKICKNCRRTYAALVGFGCFKGHKKTNEQLQDNTMAENCLDYRSTKRKLRKVVVLYSGGLDSTVLLAKCKRECDEVIALNFSYGSKHNWAERRAARTITKLLNISYYEYDILTTCEMRRAGHWDTSNIVDFLKSDLLKSGGEIPEGDYNEENMKSTVVPFRNGIMLALAAGFAESRGFNIVAIANHSEDHYLYADCRPDFIEAIHKTIVLGTDGVGLYAPFTNITKADIVKLGYEINAPLELTWSCYKGKEKHCGLCGTCRERKKAFLFADILDPTVYEIMYAIGQNDNKGGYGIWAGPISSEEQMLKVIGRDDNSVIIRFNSDGTDEVIWKWDIDQWRIRSL